MANQISEFRMPRYREIPDVGLYLDQVVKYVNRFLAPLGCLEMTASMVSNYVKKGYISNPVRKQYDAEQIARLLFIAVTKAALSMENIVRLFQMQKETYEVQVAYDFFCDQLEMTLQYTFGLRDAMEPYHAEMAPGGRMLRATIIAVAHIIYLSKQFEAMDQETLSPTGHLALPEATTEDEMGAGRTERMR